MPIKGLLIVDGMSIAHASNNAKPLTMGEQPTQAVYGFLRSLRQAQYQFPNFAAVVLWDGSSWRNTLYADYKISRNKEPETKYELQAAGLKTQLKSQLPYIRKALKVLGVRQMHALNLEADDLAAIIVRKNAGKRKAILISGDKDWIQLIGPGIGWFDPIRDTSITLRTIEEKLGVKTPHAWLECKALMGDNSDDIPGVGGIGEKGAKELLNTYGSVAGFRNMVIDKTIDVAKLPKKFRDLAEAEEKHEFFLRNMQLMDLNSPRIPEPVRLTVSAAENQCLACFHELCMELGFRSIYNELTNWCEPFFTKPTMCGDHTDAELEAA